MMKHKCGIRSRIRNGDLLVWSQYPKGANSFWLNTVRLMTRSNYGHVSNAVIVDGELYHYEAVIPKIRLVKVPDNAEFFVVPARKVLGKEVPMTFFDDKVGLYYSISDALSGYFGIIPKADDRWQCAELAMEFYQSLGLNLHVNKVTPTKLVTAMLRLCGTSLVFVPTVADSPEPLACPL